MIETLHAVHYGFMDTFSPPTQVLSVSKSTLPVMTTSATMLMLMRMVRMVRMVETVVSCIK